MRPKKIGPWTGICTQKCWFAAEKKCVCKCGGCNHGRGLSLKYRKLDDFNEMEEQKGMVVERATI